MKASIRLSLIVLLSIFLVINIGYSAKAVYPIIGYIGDKKVAHLTVNDKAVITIYSKNSSVNPEKEAKKLAKKLNKLLYYKKLRADRILPSIRNGKYVIHVDNDVIFTIDNESSKKQKLHPSILTMKWVNNLREAFGGEPFDNYRLSSRGIASYVKETNYGYASWYGYNFQGRRTTSGEVYDVNAYTAAHKTLAFGTPVLVTNLGTGRSVLVKINDRGPFIPGRSIDLSYSAFKQIASPTSGVIRVKIDILQ